MNNRKYVIEKITDKDVISESKVTLEELILQSYKYAIKENIKANSIILDKNFCKVNELDFLVGGYDYKHLPPMICGMEIRGVSDGELPDGYNFAILEAPMTEREALIRDTSRTVIRRIWAELNNALIYTKKSGREFRAVEDVIIDKIMNNMLKELHDHDNSTNESSGS